MTRLKYGVNLITYKSAGLEILDYKVAEKIFKNLRDFGYSGIELTGIPERMSELRRLKELLSSYQLEAVMIPGAWGVFGFMVNTYPNKDPTSSDPTRKANSVEYLGKCAEIAAEFGAPFIQIALGSLDSPIDITEKGIARARRNLIEVAKKASKLAANNGVKILLEPQCRFEGYYGVNSTMTQLLSIVDEVNADNVVPMIDTFHSNIEETSIPAAIRKAGKKLAHVHVADNNRRGPGWGSMDFKPILRTLHELKYSGFLCLECLPVSDPDIMCEQSMKYLRSIEELSSAQVKQG